MIYSIQRYCIHDGRGIRTNVFLKGCDLKCGWCANPESQSFKKQNAFYEEKCTGCLACERICKTGGSRGASESCTHCEDCAYVCPNEAIKCFGYELSADELVAEIIKDVKFYRKSGGGVTFSGGEVLSQPLFLLSLLKAAKREGIHTCIETSGYAPRNILEEIAPYVDTFLYDLKAIDDAVHFVCCSVSNKQILENFEYLSERCNVVARLPIIPGYNDAPKDIDLMLEYLESHHRGGHVDLLPYHRLGVNKYTRLDMPYHLKDILPPSPKRMAELKQQFISRGFSTEIGG